MKPTAPIPDVALMLKVREGDESAFEALHERYQHKVLNFFYGMSRNMHMANDLCQETFLRVWKVRKRYRATGAFPAYLFGIARMIWLEGQREQRKLWRLGAAEELDLERGLAADPACHPDRCAARSEIHERIMSALDELPEAQRMVFVMRNIRGLSLEDIAAALDCPVNTVRSRKILAVKKLRHLLSNVFVSSLERTG